MAAQYQLVMHSGPTPGKVFPLDGDLITIGREAGNNIIINDAEVSRKHTQFIFQGGKVIVSDLGSTNGTFVDGQRLTGQQVLQSGQIISLGEQISLLFETVIQVDPNATMMSTGHPPVVPMSAQVPSQPVMQSSPAMYAGQVPSGPQFTAPETPTKSGSSKILIIIIALVVLCLLCACLGFLVYQFAPLEFYCTLSPGLEGCK